MPVPLSDGMSKPVAATNSAASLWTERPTPSFGMIPLLICAPAGGEATAAMLAPSGQAVNLFDVGFTRMGVTAI